MLSHTSRTRHFGLALSSQLAHQSLPAVACSSRLQAALVALVTEKEQAIRRALGSRTAAMAERSKLSDKRTRVGSHGACVEHFGIVALSDDVVGVVCAALPLLDVLALQKTCKRLKGACEECEQWDLAADAMMAAFPLPKGNPSLWSNWRMAHDPRIGERSIPAQEWSAKPARERITLFIPFVRAMVKRAHNAAD